MLLFLPLFIGRDVQAQEFLNLESMQAKNATQIQCIFSEPFVKYTIFLPSQKVLMSSMDASYFEQGKIKEAPKTQLFLPKYIFASPKINLSIELNFQGSDGMSDTVYPMTVATLTDEGEGESWGGCFFSHLQSTHVVFGTDTDVKEPYLNLRREPTTKSAVLAKLYDGRDVTLLEEKDGWAKVVVQEKSTVQEGWVSMKYLQSILP